jgi:hypothetical protein
MVTMKNVGKYARPPVVEKVENMGILGKILFLLGINLLINIIRLVECFRWSIYQIFHLTLWVEWKIRDKKMSRLIKKGEATKIQQNLLRLHYKGAVINLYTSLML